jgi:hypothetical protein
MQRQYRRKPDQFVVAIQLDLDTEGLRFRKWGGEQRCKARDWLVDNDGDIYTVERETFAKTYEKVGPGHYRKTTPIWAEQADAQGDVPTLEGSTHYEAGDYLVANERNGKPSYAVRRDQFLAMYEPVD